MDQDTFSLAGGVEWEVIDGLGLELQRGNRIDANAKQSVGQGLIQFDNVVVNAGDLFQIVGVADARQFGFLLIRG